MKPKQTQILIDGRRGSSGLERTGSLKGMAETAHLDSADVMFKGNGPSGKVTVGIEVKSIWDFISSAGTGRLMDTQLPAMLDTYDVNWLLIYGAYRPGRNDGLLHIMRHGRWTKFKLGNSFVPYTYVEHLLTHITEMGIHVARVEDKRDAAEWIAAQASWWAKPWKDHKASRVFDRGSAAPRLKPLVLSPKIRFMAELASKLPGVGYDRAVAAAKHFKNVQEMIGADEAAWRGVPGIGKVVAKAVVAAIRQ